MQADAPKEWTVADIARWATDDFRARGLESPRLEAELLVAFALGVNRMQIIVDGARPLTPPELAKLRELVKRRRAREPMAYLRGEREFYGLVYKVDKRVLVPRPDTETLIDVALARTPDVAMGGRILDLCTGSGCLAIMAADVFPKAKIDAVDISTDALQVARRNVEDYHLQDRVALIKSDLFAALGNKRYDLILCNPPYVTEAAMARLPAEYGHEPKIALAGGADGMNLVKTVVRQARGHLKRGGLLIVEVGDGRAATEKTFGDLPLTWLTTSAGDDMVFLARQEELA